MKSFKQFLRENTTKISPTDEKKEKTAKDLVRSALTTELMGQAMFGTNAGFDTAYAIGGSYNIPPDKDRIRSEQLDGTDLGLMFDYNPDSREVEANPAGFKAAHKRESEGRSYPTAYPQGKMTADEFSQQYRDQLWKQTKSIFDPETYRILGKMAVDTFSSPRVYPPSPSPRAGGKLMVMMDVDGNPIPISSPSAKPASTPDKKVRE